MNLKINKFLSRKTVAALLTLSTALIGCKQEAENIQEPGPQQNEESASAPAAPFFNSFGHVPPSLEKSPIILTTIEPFFLIRIIF